MTEASRNTPATSFEVRGELEGLLERDLLGPWEGPEEELPPGSSPAERYLLGRLVPRDAPADEATADEDEEGEAGQDPALVEREVSADGEATTLTWRARLPSAPAAWLPQRSASRSSCLTTPTLRWWKQSGAGMSALLLKCM